MGFQDVRVGWGLREQVACVNHQVVSLIIMTDSPNDADSWVVLYPRHGPKGENAIYDDDGLLSSSSRMKRIPEF